MELVDIIWKVSKAVVVIFNLQIGTGQNVVMDLFFQWLIVQQLLDLLWVISLDYKLAVELIIATLDDQPAQRFR